MLAVLNCTLHFCPLCGRVQWVTDICMRCCCPTGSESQMFRCTVDI